MAHVGEATAAPTRPAPPNGRVVRRRSTLPGGRAVVGGMLVAAAGAGLFASFQRAAEGPRHSYVVARHDLSVGSRLQRDDLALERMELPPNVRGRVFVVPDAIVGATLLGPVASGELVQRASIVRSAASPTDREVTVPIERTRIVSGLRDGERVDVLVTYGTGMDAYTVAVVRQALVLRVDRARGSLGDSSVTLVTLALERGTDTLAVAHGSRAGQVTLARSTGVPASSDPNTYRSPPATASP